MSRPKRDTRPVHGILLLDKPVGITSNRALQLCKGLLMASKAGHTGSLDPLASGLLPLCFGEATKVSRFLLEGDKRYTAEFRLGISTATGDSEGETLETRPVSATRREIERAIEQFTGPIEQIPPMYSAIKQGGQPLYKLARAGIVTERAPRAVTVFEYKLLDFSVDRLRVDIRCSKGTYIRALAHDLGEMLGCGGHVAELRRTEMGSFRVEDAITLEALAAMPDAATRVATLVPADRALEALPAVNLTSHAAYYFVQGQPVSAQSLPREGWLRVYEEGGRFLGLAEVDDDGRAAPRRLMHLTEGTDLA